ncbi:MAG TPA: nuclear transport factor 2 family protein [Acidimicrobiales bacterium]|nr:nuclear transport factor 2 family protein [Acidimicrobiales bacterium]
MTRQFPRNEIDEAFQHYWKVGCVDEDWVAWTDLFVPDVHYVDHFWGPLRGRKQVDVWIHAVMKGVPEIYTVLDWYAIDGNRVVFRLQNRRDNPSADGPPYFDFPGLSVITYAGDGLWASEEDYWDRTGARRTSEEYAAACDRSGPTTPESRMTRRFWPDGPAWARSDDPPQPSWLDREDLPAITKPRELQELLARVIA